MTTYSTDRPKRKKPGRNQNIDDSAPPMAPYAQAPAPITEAKDQKMGRKPARRPGIPA